MKCNKSSQTIYKKLKREYYQRKDLRHQVFLRIVESADIPFKLYKNSLPNYKKRALFTKLIYMYFRQIDDIIDGDVKLNTLTNDFQKDKQILNDYMLKRIDFIQNPRNPKNELDILMSDILKLSEEIGIDIKIECLSLMQSIYFDLKRTSDIKEGKLIICSKQELEKYYFDAYMACHKIGILMTSPNENYENKNLKKLSYARRNYFILRDFLEDLNEGLINIPSEDMDYINENTLYTCITSLNKEIIETQKKKGYNHKKVLTNLDPSLINWLDAKLDISLKDLREYQKDAPLRTYKDILEEALLKKQDLSNLILRVMLEESTNSYLTKLEKQKTLIK